MGDTGYRSAPFFVRRNIACQTGLFSREKWAAGKRISPAYKE
jgi:hypothetical protein